MDESAAAHKVGMTTTALISSRPVRSPLRTAIRFAPLYLVSLIVIVGFFRVVAHLLPGGGHTVGLVLAGGVATMFARGVLDPRFRTALGQPKKGTFNSPFLSLLFWCCFIPVVIFVVLASAALHLP